MVWVWYGMVWYVMKWNEMKCMYVCMYIEYTYIIWMQWCVWWNLMRSWVSCRLSLNSGTSKGFIRTPCGPKFLSGRPLLTVEVNWKNILTSRLPARSMRAFAAWTPATSIKKPSWSWLSWWTLGHCRNSFLSASLAWEWHGVRDIAAQAPGKNQPERV